jgi:hypothetical protein
MIPFTRLGLQQMQMLGAGAPTAGLPRFITDLFNLLQNSPTYTGGPLTTTDYLGNLVTSPAGVPALEGGRLTYDPSEGALVGPELSTNSEFTTNITGFSGLNWAWNPIDGGVVKHTPGAANTLSSSSVVALTANTMYLVSYAVGGMTVGSVQPKINATENPLGVNRNGEYVLLLSSPNPTGLYFTPSIDFDGYIKYARVSSITPKWLSNTSIQLSLWGDSMSTEQTANSGYATALRREFPYLPLYGGGVGGDTSTQIKTRMLADTDKYDNEVFIWAGRNNYASPETVKSDIATMVAAVTSGRYAVLSIFNGNTGTELLGGNSYNIIAQLNADLSALYGDNFIDLRSYIVSQYNPDQVQDVSDFANDLPPTSLRTDYLHLNQYGNHIAAKYLWTWMLERGWRSGGEIVVQPSISIPTRSGTKQWYQEPFANPFGYSNWPARTNLFLNSNTPVTQGITTTAQAYTISVLGTGDVTVSGTATGTATEGSPLTVTATAGTLTCTVTGTLSRVQVEAGAFASPWIETAAATVTRAATNLSNPLTLAPQMQLVVIPAATGTAGTLLDDGTNKLSYNGTNLIFMDGITTLSAAATLTAGTAYTIGVKGLAGDWALSLNTVDLDTDATGTVVAWATAKLGRNAADGDHFAGYFPNAAGFSGSDPLWYKTNLGA